MKLLNILNGIDKLLAEWSDIERTPVFDSTNIKSIGYDPSEKTLAIEFISGHSKEYYEFLNVPKIVVTKLMDAKSKGSYFHRNIKGQYQSRRVTE